MNFKCFRPCENSSQEAENPKPRQKEERALEKYGGGINDLYHKPANELAERFGGVGGFAFCRNEPMRVVMFFALIV